MFDSIYVILFLLGVPFFAYAFYNIFIGLKGYRKYRHYPKAAPKNRFCAVVAARNEEGVIGQLVDTLKNVDYPEELVDIWVIPNNCTDETGRVAREHGANVYDPKREIHSKGEALNEFFDYTFAMNDTYDAFCVFDADNLVDPHFFKSMNNALESGVRIAQGYRESKNPKDSWVSGCQSVFYWTINRFMNESKMGFGLSATLNGTGFMVCREILEKDGFNTFSLTEDIEFSTQNIMKGETVYFVSDAITYDEHPTDQATSWKQRSRWSTGTIQCLYHYGPMLWKDWRETKNFKCFDMLVYLLAPFLQVLSTIYGVFTIVIYAIISLYQMEMSNSFIFAVGLTVVSLVFSVIYSMFVVKMEHHKVNEVAGSAFFSFWYFIMSWAIINIIVFFKPITTWEPIEHKKGVELADIEKAGDLRTVSAE